MPPPLIEGFHFKCKAGKCRDADIRIYSYEGFIEHTKAHEKRYRCVECSRFFVSFMGYGQQFSGKRHSHVGGESPDLPMHKDGEDSILYIKNGYYTNAHAKMPVAASQQDSNAGGTVPSTSPGTMTYRNALIKCPQALPPPPMNPDGPTTTNNTSKKRPTLTELRQLMAVASKNEQEAYKDFEDSRRALGSRMDELQILWSHVQINDLPQPSIKVLFEQIADSEKSLDSTWDAVRELAEKFKKFHFMRRILTLQIAEMELAVEVGFLDKGLL